MSAAAPLGLYVHVPYCSVRCSYCDFYLVPAAGRDLEGYVGDLCREIDAAGEAWGGRAADSVHFGGGTPSLLAPPLVGRILAALSGTFRLARDGEIALEANPEDVRPDRLGALRDLGVNRLTLGVQALDDRVLGLLRRPHGAAQALRAVEAALTSGIRSIGVDLILGLPGQESREALAGIERLAGTPGEGRRGIEHVSLYLLEIHPRTRLGREVALGRVAPMGDDAAAGLYEEAADLLESLGFEHYEISNFARTGHRSRHNMKYWTDEEYLGFGPSAHSYAAGRRWSNAADLRAYLESAGRAARQEDSQPAAGRAAEALFAGLRLAEGVDLGTLRGRYGEGLPGPSDPAVAGLLEAGLLVLSGPRLRLTRRGRLVSNEVFERLLS